MKKLSQRTFDKNIDLVKYENPPQRDCFDMTTIHSLLIDQNPKFSELCQLVNNFNSKEINREVTRPNLQRPFIERLYKMLSELTRITHTQNQLRFLNRIYHWAFEEKTEGPMVDSTHDSGKERPGTASTRTRPYSAHTKKTRPDSAVPTKASGASRNNIDGEQINKKVIEMFPKVDFTDLKHGQKQFFLGYRTFHPELEKPKVRLKQFQRKVFYDEPDEEDQFKQFAEQKKEIFVTNNLVEELPIEEENVQVSEPNQGDPNNPQENVGEQPVEGQEGQQGQQVQEAFEGAVPGEEDLNIEGAGGEEEPGIVEEQEPEVIDKLRPRVKVYGDEIKPINRVQTVNYYKGIAKQQMERNKKDREVEENKMMRDMMELWAGTKNKIKMQQRRRAESARIDTKKTGTVFEKYIKKENENYNCAQIFDLSQPNIAEIRTNIRPISAFPAASTRVYNESINNAILVGELTKHVNISKNGEIADQSERLCKFAPKPKKKTFEEILREAEAKVSQETMQEIEEVKQKLTNNRVALGANKIFKSLSHHEPQLLDGQFMGQITGKGMLSNPFFKVGKKKKKKKKK